MPPESDSASCSAPFKRSYSLRTRYLVVTGIVTVIILAGALFAQRYVERVGEMRSESLQLRNEAITQIRLLRNAILKAERDLDAFLWQPSDEQRQQLTQALDSVVSAQQHLYTLKWYDRSNMAKEMDDFEHDIEGLRISIDHLTSMRLDPLKQDPYLALHSEYFQPATYTFHQSITNALQHIEASVSRQLHSTLHQPLEDLRNEWMRLDILAESYNGISSSSYGNAQAGINALVLRHHLLQENIERIGSRISTLPGTTPLAHDWQRIRASSEKWNDGFQHLQQLVKNGRQRGDILFLVTTIEPQFAHIWDYLQRLDETSEAMANRDVSELAEAATTIAHALWLLAFIGLALLITGLVYFERSVLSPIVMVANALRNEARGQQPLSLPSAQSQETHHLIDAFSQMRDQVQQRQRSLEHLALHDTLTGLANREQLVRTIDQALQTTDSKGQPLAILIIALDRFREINISLGHNVGDQLLRAIAERLSHLSFAQRLVARLGGDEFAVLLLGQVVSEAETIARSVINELEFPFEVANQSLFLGASIGIALAPDHGSHAQELLQKADVAAHVAKRQRNNNVIYYGSEHDEHALRRLSLANMLRLALQGEAHGLSLAYQPQIDIFNRKFSGVEVLLRWNHPQEGHIGPDELIPIAEHTGLIYQLTPWVLEQAFSEFANWQELSDTPLLAVNLSVFNLYDDDFPTKLKQLMEKWRIKPATLQLEITESAMMANPVLAQRTLVEIHRMGVELAIDDFGTGFSSLTYLKHLPVSKLKIDKSFVMSMLDNDNDAVIIRSTIDMAHNLGLKVVAEGVETPEAFNLLEILGCDVAQGFYFSRPLELEALISWVQQHAGYGKTAHPYGSENSPPSLYS